MRYERLAQSIGMRLARHRAQMQRHFYQHPAKGGHNGGREEDRMLKPGMFLHLGQMLVIEGQAIGAKGEGRLGVKPLDQRFAAARISAYRIDGVGPIGWQQASSNQRGDQRQKACWIASRVGDKLRIGYCLMPDDFGKAIGPSLGDAMR